MDTLFLFKCKGVDKGGSARQINVAPRGSQGSEMNRILFPVQSTYPFMGLYPRPKPNAIFTVLICTMA